MRSSMALLFVVFMVGRLTVCVCSCRRGRKERQTPNIGLTELLWISKYFADADIRGSNLGGVRGFPQPSRSAMGAHPASYTMGTGSFPGLKRPGRGVDHPSPSSVKGKERVELYLYSTSGSSWPVIGWTLPYLTITFSYSSSSSFSSSSTSSAYQTVIYIEWQIPGVA